MNTKKIIGYGIAVMIALIVAGCPSPDGTEQNPDGMEQGAAGSVTGKAAFANPASSGKITVYLEKTDGFHIESGQRQAKTARTVGGSGAITTIAGTDGSYAFEDVKEGIYTIYASSADETEQAVLINIPVEGETETTVEPMALKPVGSIKGRIVLDGGNNNLGFTVFIAGTSYMAITNQAGTFEIPNVPAGSGYEIAVMRGNYAAIWTITTVESEDVTDLEQFDVTSAEINGDAMMWKGALSAPPANPQKNWAYLNLTDKTTYIYDGTEWQVMAQIISTNTVVYQGNGNTGGTAPVDRGNYVYGIHVLIKDKGNLEKEGYRFGGWSLGAGGGGQRYQPGETIIIQDTQIIFYAVWLPLYTVTYNGNGNTSGTAPASVQGVTGEQVMVANAGNLQRTGYRFMGWSTNQTATSSQYASDSSFTIGAANTTLYAVWSKLFTVSFNTNGYTPPNTTPIPSLQGISGEQIELSYGFHERPDYYFAGWNTRSDATGTAFEPARSENNWKIPVVQIGNADIVLYAIWSEFDFDGSYKGTSKDLVIPATINKVPLTDIRDLLYSNLGLTSVVIPNGVTYIGRNAFSQNPLTRIVIPGGLTITGNYTMGIDGGTFLALYDGNGKKAGTYTYDEDTGWSME